MYNHNNAQQNKNCVHISWDILYIENNFVASNVTAIYIMLLSHNTPSFSMRQLERHRKRQIDIAIIICVTLNILWNLQ